MNLDKLYADLKIVYNYMNLGQEVKKCDLIIGCGCSDLSVPKICSDLKKQGYADKILFTGGYGKVTRENFQKTEAEIFLDIAISEGIPKSDIYLEKKSKNTGDNFRYSKKIIEEEGLNVQSILIVHNTISERRTFNTARAIMPDYDIVITSENLSFDNFFENLKKKSQREIYTILSVITANIQRMILYPQFGFQIEDNVPKEVEEVYQHLKSLEFDQYIMKKSDIRKLASKYDRKEEHILYFE